MPETLWHRLVRGVRRLRQQPGWSQLAGPDWADRIMDVVVHDDFHAKQGRTIARWTLHSGGRRVAYATNNAGIPTYAVSGAFMEAGENRAHGRDERLGVRAFDEDVEYTYRLVKALGANP